MAVEPSKPKGRRKPFPGEEHLTTRPGSAAWHYDFTIDGTRLRGNCGTGDLERAAAYAAACFGREFDRIRLGVQPAKHLTLNDAFAKFYVEVGKGTSYGDNAQRHQMARMLRILPRDMRLADLSDSHVNDLVQTLRTTPLALEGPHAGKVASPATCNRYVNTLSAVCKRAREVWGVEVGTWKRGQHLQAEPEGREVFLEMDTARRVLAAATPHVRALMAWDIVTGLRKANATHVMWEQINLPERKATFIQKGGKRLAVPLPDEAVILLEAIEPDPEKRKGPVFYYGNPTAACTCSACVRKDLRGKQFSDPKRSIKTAFRLAGLPPTVRMHDLRHTFASWLLDAGGDLKLVKERLGHANIQTTMRYAHISDARQRSVVQAAVRGLLAPSAEVIALPAPPKRDEEAA